MYRIFTNEQAMADHSRHIHMLFPFWGGAYKAYESAQLFQSYIDNGRQIFELVDDLPAADFAILPADYTRYVQHEQVDRATQFAQQAQNADVPVIVMNSLDAEWEPPFDHIMFRTSIVKSKQARPDLFALPGWSRDLALEMTEPWYARPKTTRPTASFMGTSGWGIRDWVRHARRYWGYLRGKHGARGVDYPLGRAHRIRQRVLNQLEEHPAIQTDFVVRQSRYARQHMATPAQTEQHRQRAWREYRENIMNSDYVVCVRGNGNYSFRFYETLSAGRIPIFINTDCQLPYENHINWHDHVIWIEERDIDAVGDIVAAYHAALSPEDFVARQHANQQLWREWLSPMGFFERFHLHFG